MIPSGKLMLFGAGGLASCFAIAKVFKHKVSSTIKASKFFEEAMEILTKHQGAIYLLGQPIQGSIAKYCGNYMSSDRTDVKVYLSGPKSTGILFYSVLLDKENKYSLSDIQLQIGSDDTKRLVIK